MKKRIAMILTLLLILSLCACDKGRDTANGKDSTPATASDLSWEEIEKRAEEELAKENG